MSSKKYETRRYEVSRDKYESAKKAAQTWHKVLEEKQEELDKVLVENEEIRKSCEKWKEFVNNLPEQETVEELEKENKSLKKEMKKMKEQYDERIAKLEREKLLADGKIQQLEEAKKDLRERYDELKQDYRELQRGNKA